jgi:hypothetical protein
VKSQTINGNPFGFELYSADDDARNYYIRMVGPKITFSPMSNRDTTTRDIYLLNIDPDVSISVFVGKNCKDVKWQSSEIQWQFAENSDIPSEDIFKVV